MHLIVHVLITLKVKKWKYVVLLSDKNYIISFFHL